MGDYRDEYLDWKKKNEILMERIKKIEQEIDQKQNTLFEKKCYADYLKEKSERYKQIQQKYQSYDHLLKQLDVTKTESESLFDQQQQQQPTGRKRREIADQLILTPDIICRQMERSWKKNNDNNISSASSIPESTAQGKNAFLSHMSLGHYQKNIQRLMEQHSPEQYLLSIEDLLKQEINKSKQIKFSIDALYNGKQHQNRHQVGEEEKEKEKEGRDIMMDTLSKEEKLKSIAHQQNKRLEHVMQLEKEAEHWKHHTKMLEHQLHIETRQRYNDPQIQTAYINFIKAKATKAKEQSQISYAKHHLEEMEKVLATLKEKYKPIEDLDQTIETKLKFKMEKAMNLHLENLEGQKAIQDERQKILNLINEIDELRDGLNSKRIRDDILTIDDLISENINPNEKLLKQIGDKLNPSYELAPSYIVKRLKDQSLKYDLLSSQEPSKLNNELEALVLSWNDELKGHGVLLPESSNETDAIDIVAQAIKALKDHADNDWKNFTSDQEKLLNNKLDLLEDGSKDIQEINQLLKERNTIIKGDIGTDYTVQDRNLEEWFQLADDQS
ncbi:hypothetical protein BJ944DRAFT_20275 [Cunninghamella echinulata]|nr:hypothetical protein BJ944DRAFT_20275 [Cunninghamella echinulata]